MMWRTTEKQCSGSGSGFGAGGGGKNRRTWSAAPRMFVIMLAVLWMGAGMIPHVVLAEDATEIMRSVQDQQDAETSAMRISMHVYDRPGSDESRDMYIESYSRGEEESYMEFVSPRSIKGLRVQDLDGEIRVFFPSTGRVRRIASGQRGGSIGGVGGDFSYEDMGSGSLLEDYEFTLLREEHEEYIIRGVPTDPDSSYEHLIYYVEKARSVVTRIEYHTPADGHEKTMTADSFERIQGRLVATEITMENHRKHRRTVLRIHDARFDVPLDNRYFNPNRFYR